MKVLVLSAGGIAESELSGIEAVAIAFTPTDGILADNVQAAIVELDSEVVHKTGDETISGLKTFTNGIVSGENISIPDSAWDAGMLELGGYYFWVDGGGFLRIKFGAPASINDGSIVGATGAVAADDVSFTPTGSIGSTDVQNAIVEVNSEAQSALAALDGAVVHTIGDESVAGVKTFTESLLLPNVAWNNKIFSVAGYRFWINGGKLYFKNGTPASATDGSVIGPVTASDVAFTPTGNIAASTVQGAIAELDSEALHTTGNESAAGVKIFTDATEATNDTTGGFQVRGGFSVKKNAFIGGSLLLANYPSLCARRTTNATLTSGTPTKMVYNQEEEDSHGAYDATSGDYLIPAGCNGKYNVGASVSVSFSGTASTTVISLQVYLNGILYTTLDRALCVQVSGATDGCGMNVDIPGLVAGDKINIYVTATYSGGTITIAGADRCSLYIKRIR